MICGLAVFSARAVVFVDVLRLGRTEPTLAPEPERVLLEKAARRLTLLREGRVLATEGLYMNAVRIPRGVAHLSLKLSYPSPPTRLRPGPSVTCPAATS